MIQFGSGKRPLATYLAEQKRRAHKTDTRTVKLTMQVEIQGTYALFERIFEYLDTPSDISNKLPVSQLKLEEVRGEVSFRNVTLSQQDDAYNTLTGIIDEKVQNNRVVKHSPAPKLDATHEPQDEPRPSAIPLVVQVSPIRETKLPDQQTLKATRVKETEIRRNSASTPTRIQPAIETETPYLQALETMLKKRTSGVERLPGQDINTTPVLSTKHLTGVARAIFSTPLIKTRS